MTIPLLHKDLIEGIPALRGYLRSQAFRGRLYLLMFVQLQMQELLSNHAQTVKSEAKTNISKGLNSYQEHGPRFSIVSLGSPNKPQIDVPSYHP